MKRFFQNILNRLKPNKANVVTIRRNSLTDFVDYSQFINTGKNIVLEFDNSSIKNIEDVNSPDIEKGTKEITGGNYRIFTISEWRNAILRATAVIQPNWSQLFYLYENAIEDAHINACLKTLRDRLLAKNFYVEVDGEKDEDASKIFHSRWFYDFQCYVFDAVMWGFSLIKLGDYDTEENRFLSVDQVNRRHIDPKKKGVLKHENDYKPFKYWIKEPYKTWTIFVWSNALGELNKVLRWYLYKTEVARFWAEYNETYGVPPVIAKTDLYDNERKKNLVSFLQNFSDTLFGIVDKKDEIEKFDGGTSTTSADLYEKFLRFCDEQISKSLLGSTMVLDDGSSRSQSEVHEQNTDLIVKSICRLVEFTVNDELIPRMQKIGASIDSEAVFKYDESEKLTIKDYSEILRNILPFKQVSSEEIQRLIGIETEDKEIELPPVDSVQEVENYYKSLFNGNN